MRFLKLFEELNYDTYRDASDQFMKKGYYKKSKNLINHAEERAWMELVEKYSKFGSYKIKIGYEKNDLYNSEFYIALYAQTDMLRDSITSDIESGEGYISFYMALIPKTIEDLQMAKSYDLEIYKGAITGMFISIPYEIKDTKVNLVMRRISAWHGDDAYFSLGGRKETSQLKQLFIDIYGMEMEYPSMNPRLIEAPFLENNLEFNSYQIAEFFDTISNNKLMEEFKQDF